MCGITGVLSTALSRDQIQFNLEQMNQAIAHRGPDDAGMFIDEGVGLAMRRLAILDLSPTGKQPMMLDAAGLVMVYNGELYNYKEIREELEAKGHTFRGGSDTEVLLHAYQEWGVQAFIRFNGMFALAIWDKTSRKLLLARDRVGEKPLFYWQGGGHFVFASEVKSLLKFPYVTKEIDREALFHYLVYNSAPSSNSILAGVKQVKPRSVMLVHANGNIEEQTYWQIPPLQPDPSLTEAEIIDQVHELLIDAVRLRLRSDVPVGVFLSGGVDSSLISAIAAKLQPGIQTFSVGYNNDRFDESRYAIKIAEHLHTEHHTILVQPGELDMKAVLETSDDPLGSSTIFPYLKLAEFARKNVSVALAGDGGDEFFCGYVGFRQISQILNLRKHVPAPLWNWGAKLGYTLASYAKVNPGLRTLEFDTPAQFVAQFICRLPLREVAALVSPHPVPTIPAQYVIDNGDYSFPRLNHKTASTYLHDTVLKTSDRATMHHSLEGRLPLTDHRLIELASRIPAHIQFKQGTDKYVLKQILWRYVPRELVDRPKTGFGLPSRDWLFGPWVKLIDFYLSPEHLALSGALDVKAVRNLVEVAQQRRRGYDRIVWNLLIFQLWWEHIVLNNTAPAFLSGPYQSGS